MKTRKEIAAELGIKETTLASRLWEVHSKPSAQQAVKQVYLYDEKAVEEIRALFKFDGLGKPVKSGRPKKEKKP